MKKLMSVLVCLCLTISGLPLEVAAAEMSETESILAESSIVTKDESVTAEEIHEQGLEESPVIENTEGDINASQNECEIESFPEMSDEVATENEEPSEIEDNSEQVQEILDDVSEIPESNLGEEESISVLNDDGTLVYTVPETNILLTYYVSADGIIITDCNEDASGKLIIPDSIDGISVIWIDDRGFENCSSLTAIELPDSIAKIGKYAFHGCNSLSEIKMPENMVKIGENAFLDCSSITSAGPVGSGADYEYGWSNKIPPRAFQGCNGLLSVEIPESITEIGSYAFSECWDLRKIDFLENVAKIGNYAFQRCNSVEKIIVPEQITSIGIGAFFGCNKIQSAGPTGSGADYEFGWTSAIPSYAFQGCESLNSIAIPEYYTEIGSNAFSKCYALTTVAIPENITSIGAEAFQYCEKLSRIQLSKNVINIGENAFDYCNGFTSAGPIGSGADYEFSWTEEIPANAFGGCRGLVQVQLPEETSAIGNYAFHDCILLSEINWPDSIMEIGDYAFRKCENLPKIKIVQDVKLGNSPFGLCSSIISAGPLESGADYEFGWQESIPDDAFSGCIGLVSVELPQSIVKIGESAFSGCNSLNQIKLPEKLNSIGSLAFSYSGLKRIEVPGSVTNMGSNVFRGCSFTSAGPISSDAEYQFGWNLVVPEDAFAGCINLISIELPKSITAIGQRAMSACTKLLDIKLPDGLSKIEHHTFEYCRNLKSIEMPESIVSIDDYAFYYCDSLTDVYFWGTEEEWNQIKIGKKNHFLQRATIHFGGGESSLERELIDKVRLYTSDGGKSYTSQLEQLLNLMQDIPQEQRVRVLNEFYTKWGIADAEEGVSYVYDAMNAKMAYDFLRNDEVFLAYQYLYYLNCTTKGKAARGLLLADDWIFNNALMQYINPNTYIKEETNAIKNYKTMLLDFMEYDSVSYELLAHANNLLKAAKGAAEIVDDTNYAMFSSALQECETKVEMDKLFDEYIKTQEFISDGTKAEWHIQGYDSFNKLLGGFGKTILVTSTVLNDITMFATLETRLNVIDHYDEFLQSIEAGKEALPYGLVVAAEQLREELVEPYRAPFKVILGQLVKNRIDGKYNIEKFLTTNIGDTLGSMLPDSLSFDGQLLGDAIATIKLSAFCVDCMTGIGGKVKQSAYVEAYAYLGMYYSDLLMESGARFREHESIKNAWEFYDLYQLLFAIRVKGENTFLKMNEATGLMAILANAGDWNYLGIKDKTAYVNDTFEYMNTNCMFELENASQIPEGHRYAQKAVISCPVNVKIYKADGTLIYTLYDGVESDESNEYGRFVCTYRPSTGDYTKAVYLYVPENYVIRAVGVDMGTVNISTARQKSSSVETAQITGLPIHEGGTITVQMDSNEYLAIPDSYAGIEYKGALAVMYSKKYIPLEQLKLSPDTLSLKEGCSEVLGVYAVPQTASFTDVYWESSNPEIVAVNEKGVLKAVAAGTSIITARYVAGEISATCLVTVSSDDKVTDTPENPKDESEDGPTVTPDEEQGKTPEETSDNESSGQTPEQIPGKEPGVSSDQTAAGAETGDESDYVLWIMIFGISILGLIYCKVSGKPKRKKYM